MKILKFHITSTNSSEKEVRIGEGSWLGVGVSVIGASIGKHCVIGSNAVVTKDIQIIVLLLVFLQELLNDITRRLGNGLELTPTDLLKK